MRYNLAISLVGLRTVIIVSLLSAAVMITLGVFAGNNHVGGADRVAILRKASKELLGDVQKLAMPRVTKKMLISMILLPESDKARAIQEDEQARIIRYKKKILEQSRARFDKEWLPLDKLADRLFPLEEKVGGLDCFAATIDTPLGLLFFRATYNHFFVFLQPDPKALSEVPKEKLCEYSRIEREDLSEDDRLRYELTNLSFEKCRSANREYYIATALGFAIEKPLSKMSEAQENLRNRALATLYLVSKDKTLTRCKWRIQDAAVGLLGESIISFPEHIIKVGEQNVVAEGYIVRFFANANIVCIMLSRHPDIFHLTQVPPQAPNDLVFLNWFSWDVDKRLEGQNKQAE